MAEGQRSPNATEARLSRAPSWQHGSGVGRIYPQLDFGAGCFNEHRMRLQNCRTRPVLLGKVRTAPGEACPCPGCGKGLGVPRLRVPTLSPRLWLSPTPPKGRHCPGSREATQELRVQPRLGFDCGVSQFLGVCGSLLGVLNKLRAQGAKPELCQGLATLLGVPSAVPQPCEPGDPTLGAFGWDRSPGWGWCLWMPHSAKDPLAGDISATPLPPSRASGSCCQLGFSH